MHFTQVWESYIVAGYGSRKNIPQEMVHIQLQPFINASWWATLLEMDIKKKTFEEIPEAIKAVANLHITLHDRRLDFLKSKRGNMAHSEFLMLLEQKIDQTSYKEWTRDQMCATLFLTYADVEMSKVVTSLINKDKLNMVELRAQIRALEATPWYKGTRDSAKLSSATGGTGPNGTPPGGKWCTNCSRSTHNTDQCWGICPHCNGKGHQAEKCRFKKDAETKAAEAELKA